MHMRHSPMGARIPSRRPIRRPDHIHRRNTRSHIRRIHTRHSIRSHTLHIHRPIRRSIRSHIRHRILCSRPGLLTVEVRCRLDRLPTRLHSRRITRPPVRAQPDRKRSGAHRCRVDRLPTRRHSLHTSRPRVSIRWRARMIDHARMNGREPVQTMQAGILSPWYVRLLQRYRQPAPTTA